MDQDAAPQEALRKLDALKRRLEELAPVAIAFSAGVDSTLLLKVAHDTLGEDAIAVTSLPASYPAREASAADAFCRREGIRHIAIGIDQLAIPGFDRNPPDRCYICKKALFEAMEAAVPGYRLCEGSNRDDEGDYRPGLRAISELGVASPLRDAGLWKDEIRSLSRMLGLDTWDKPSLACLASRFAYGERLDEERLEQVDAAERHLQGLGFGQIRVRVHEDASRCLIARIEAAPDELPLLFERRADIGRTLKELGFAYVAMDLAGYRTGSMNEGIARTDRT